MMKNIMIVMLSVIALVLLSLPPGVQAQVSDAISQTNQAIIELTDFPANGMRYSVDMTKLGGADVRQIKKATELLQDALSKARSGNADPKAIMKLEEAVAYGRATMHKETRLLAQGALYYLCAGQSGDPCDKAPKYGSYVAP
jgi:hypothetical protein